jgi:hypothetical protein
VSDGVVAASGPEIVISVVGEDDVAADIEPPAGAPPIPRAGVHCEKCGKQAAGTEVFCGQCGARIAL